MAVKAMTSSMALLWQYSYHDAVPEYWYSQVVEGAGCANIQDTLECLRAADTELLQSLDKSVSSSAFMRTVIFVPVVDGELITQSPIEALNNGQMNGEGVLAVTNANEGVSFIDTDFAVSYDVAGYVHNFFPGLKQESIDYILELYSDLGEMSSSVRRTSLRRHFHRADTKEFALPPALHTSDMAYYFPTTHKPAYVNPIFSSTFAGSLISFAESGVPSGEYLPDWPLYGSNNIEMIFNATEAGKPDHAAIAANSPPQPISSRTRVHYTLMMEDTKRHLKPHKDDVLAESSKASLKSQQPVSQSASLSNTDSNSFNYDSDYDEFEDHVYSYPSPAPVAKPSYVPNPKAKQQAPLGLEIEDFEAQWAHTMGSSTELDDGMFEYYTSISDSHVYEEVQWFIPVEKLDPLDVSPAAANERKKGL
ncbi:alpha/beta-hydrolase [Cylindrobasidium torrendii FP15055 ss-10]|uniref:Alpha/beta-hydrolase n=1 Tax=Cylindrobasidium torrendii FP15055 ss-10 TaxID=1314674 RepID=A0A0D7BCK5_9AGAR|nr:alpha/beta-hydrolase [Cylindrobasidium torrendii FP15055 ss-10]